MNRLRWRLLAAMVALVVVTVGATALFTRRVTHDQVRRLLIARGPMSLDEAVRPIEDHVRAAGGLSGVDAVIDRVTAALRVRVVLTTPRGDVIAASPDLRTAKITLEGDDQVTVRYARDGHLEQLTVRARPRSLRDAGGAPSRGSTSCRRTTSKTRRRCARSRPWTGGSSRSSRSRRWPRCC